MIKRLNFESDMFNFSPWEVVTRGGKRALKSNKISDSQDTTVSVNLICNYLEINTEVSSEAKYDFLSVLVDDIEVIKISGATTQSYSVDLAQGYHKITFKYTKDSSQLANSDCGYILDVFYGLEDSKYLLLDEGVLKTFDTDLGRWESTGETIPNYSNLTTYGVSEIGVDFTGIVSDNPTIYMSGSNPDYSNLIIDRLPMNNTLEQKYDYIIPNNITTVEILYSTTLGNHIKWSCSVDMGATWLTHVGGAWIDTRDLDSDYRNYASVEILSSIVTGLWDTIVEGNNRIRFRYYYDVVDSSGECSLNKVRLNYV